MIILNALILGTNKVKASSPVMDHILQYPTIMIHFAREEQSESCYILGK